MAGQVRLGASGGRMDIWAKVKGQGACLGGWPLWAKLVGAAGQAPCLCPFVPALGAGMWFIVFMASMISTVWPSVTVAPTVTKGVAPGSAAR